MSQALSANARSCVARSVEAPLRAWARRISRTTTTASGSRVAVDLVDQDERHPEREGADERRLPAQATRQGAERDVAAAVERERLDESLDPLGPDRAGAVQRPQQAGLLEDGDLLEADRIVRDERQRCPRLARPGRSPTDRCLTFVGADEPGDEVEERRLARAVRTDQTDGLPSRHDQIDRSERDARPVALAEAARRREEGEGGAPPPSLPGYLLLQTTLNPDQPKLISPLPPLRATPGDVRQRDGVREPDDDDPPDDVLLLRGLTAERDSGCRVSRRRQPRCRKCQCSAHLTSPFIASVTSVTLRANLQRVCDGFVPKVSRRSVLHTPLTEAGYGAARPRTPRRTCL